MPAEPCRIPLSRVALADAADPALAVAEGSDRRRFTTRVAAWRAAFDATPGNDFALHLDDGFEFVAALFGGWQAGKVLWLPGDTLPATLAMLDARVQGRAGNLPGGLAAVELDAVADDARELDADACRLVLFTSGSTGDPCAVSKTLRQLDNEIAALEAQFGTLLGDAVVQGTVSHQHIYGLLFRLLWPLSTRRRFARLRVAYNEGLTILGPEPLVLVASPAHLKRLPHNQDWSSLAQGLRAVFSSGGPLSADAAHEVRQLFGQAAIEVFGSTETGGIAWRQSAGGPETWRALPGVHWRLAGGALEVRSPHLADGDWMPTQDLAVTSADGGFELRGRADRILKIEERRISLSAIERRLLASPLLAEARVVALPGHRILLAVAAALTAAGQDCLATRGRRALTAQLRDWLSGHADAIAQPRRWRFLDALPLDERGKTSERALLALFRPHMPEPAWQQRDAFQASLQLDVHPDLAGFEGHFPQAAILPGVVLLDWAVRLGREAFALERPVLRMETLKFQHLVRPGTRLQLQLDWQAAPALLGFRFQSEQGVHASGRVRFEADAAA